MTTPGCALIAEPLSERLAGYQTCGMPRVDGSRFCAEHAALGPRRRKPWKPARDRCAGIAQRKRRNGTFYDAPCARFAGADGYCSRHRRSAAAAEQGRAFNAHELVRVDGRYGEVARATADLTGAMPVIFPVAEVEFDGGDVRWYANDTLAALDECEQA